MSAAGFCQECQWAPVLVTDPGFPLCLRCFARQQALAELRVIAAAIAELERRASAAVQTLDEVR